MQRLFLILLFMFLVSCGGRVEDSNAVVGLSAEELKATLQADTTHVKALLFYSQACHSCKEMFAMHFKEAIDSCNGDVHFYIVSQDSAFMQPPAEYWPRGATMASPTTSPPYLPTIIVPAFSV